MASLAIAVIIGSAAGARADGMLVHPGSHFQIQVPQGWYAWKDLNVSGEIADVIMRGSLDNASGPVGGFIVVTSEPRNVVNQSSEADAILQEGIDNLSATAPGFRILEPPESLLVDGHFAAKVVFWTQPSTYEVVQILIVVIGPEWDRFWALVGGMFIWDVPSIGPTVNASLASFDVLPTSPSTGSPGGPSSLGSWLIVGGLLAIAAAGLLTAGALLIRGSRNRRS